MGDLENSTAKRTLVAMQPIGRAIESGWLFSIPIGAGKSIAIGLLASVDNVARFEGASP
jgi:hypothetical protein